MLFARSCKLELGCCTELVGAVATTVPCSHTWNSHAHYTTSARVQDYREGHANPFSLVHVTCMICTAVCSKLALFAHCYALLAGCTTCAFCLEGMCMGTWRIDMFRDRILFCLHFFQVKRVKCHHACSNHLLQMICLLTFKAG